MKRVTVLAFVLLLSVFLLEVRTDAQTTEITFQGQLQSSSAVANGNFDFEFALYDGGGAQIGSTINRNGVAVSNGIFSVNLDFGSSFPGATRFLEIRVRQAGGGAFTTLSPRQPITSSPYSIKSLTADTATNAVNAATANTAVNATTAVISTNFTGNLSGDVTGTQNATTVARLQNRTVASTLPTNGQVLKYNSTTNQWEPNTDNTGAGGGGTITAVTPGTGLTGGGTTGSVSLGIANSGVGTAQLADNSVTSPKIATGQVVKSLNSLTDNVMLAAGANVTLTPTGNTLTIATTGGGSGILNQTTLQAGANFNVGGTGTANVLNASTQFNIGGVRVLSNPGTGNFFAGQLAGQLFTTNGILNSFFGDNAGGSSVSGSRNSFFGASSGASNLNSENSFFGWSSGTRNTEGFQNSFFGLSSGFSNTTGSKNSFFGTNAGFENTTGEANTYFGSSTGYFNKTGSDNAFFGSAVGNASTGNENAMFGSYSGGNNVTGNRNSFFGTSAGDTNSQGSNNTILGSLADVGAANLNNATAIGANAVVTANNSLVLGSIAGVNAATASVNVGIGTTAPLSKLDIAQTGDGAELLRFSTERPWVFRQIRTGSVSGLQLFSTVGQKYFEITSSDGTNVASFLADSTSSKVGIGTTNPIATLDIAGSLKLDILGGGGNVALCRAFNNFITTCGSSDRYKTNVALFSGGLNIVERLRPVSFDWKDGGLSDLGFVAEEVAAVDPLMVTYNEKGQVEGVKYDRLSVAFVNAFKEQQAQIDAQQRLIDKQRVENEELKARILAIEKALARRP